MAIEYPFEFTLESGTHVIIQKKGGKLYDFVLTSNEKGERHFSYDDNVTFTEEMEKDLDFDQLNALRRFWLEEERESL